MSYYGIYKGKNIPKITNMFGTDDKVSLNLVKGSESFNIEIPLFYKDEGIENKIGPINAIYSKTPIREFFELGIVNQIINVVINQDNIVTSIELNNSDGTEVLYNQVDNTNILKSAFSESYFEVEYNYTNNNIQGPKSFKLYDKMGNYYKYKYNSTNNIDIIPESYYRVSDKETISIEQEKSYLSLSCKNHYIEFNRYSESLIYGEFFVSGVLISKVAIQFSYGKLANIKKYIVYRNENNEEVQSIILNKLYSIGNSSIIVKNVLDNKYTKYYLTNNIVTNFINCFEDNELSGKNTTITYEDNKTIITNYNNLNTKYFIKNDRIVGIEYPDNKCETFAYDGNGNLLEKSNRMLLTEEESEKRENLFPNGFIFEDNSYIVENLSGLSSIYTIDTQDGSKALSVYNNSELDDIKIIFNLEDLHIKKNTGLSFFAKVKKLDNYSYGTLRFRLSLYNKDRPNYDLYSQYVNIDTEYIMNETMPISKLFICDSYADSLKLEIIVPKNDARYIISNIQIYNDLFGTINKYDEYGFVSKSYSGDNVIKRSFIKEDKTLLLASTRMDKNGSIYTYDIKGRVTEIINANGTRLLYEYDDNDNLIKETLINESDCYFEKRYTYSDDGKVLSEENENGYVTNYEYSNDNRLLSKVTYNNSLVKSYEYNEYFDIKNNKLNKSVENVLNTEYLYDDLRRIEEIKLDNEYSYQFYYDAFGNITSTYIKKNSVTELNNKLSYEVKNNVYTENVESHQVGTSPTGNNKLFYTYDAKNNLERIYLNSIADDNLLYKFNYDTNNNLSKIIDYKNNETINFSYDKYGNLVKDEKVTNGLTVVTNYKYDLKQNLIYSENKINGQILDLYSYSECKKEVKNPIHLYNYYFNKDEDIYSCLMLTDKMRKQFSNGVKNLRLGDDTEFVPLKTLANNNRVFSLMLQERPELYYYIDPTESANRTFAFWFKNDEDNNGKYLFSVSNFIKNELTNSYLDYILFKINSQNKIFIETNNYVIPETLNDNWNFISITLVNNESNSTCKINLNGNTYVTTLHRCLNNTQIQEICYGNNCTTKLESERFIGKIGCMFTCTRALSNEEVDEIYIDTSNYYIHYTKPTGNSIYDTDLITTRYLHNTCILVPFDNLLESINQDIPYYFNEKDTFNSEKDEVFIYDKTNLNGYGYKVNGNDLIYENDFTGSFAMSFNSCIKSYTEKSFLVELRNKTDTNDDLILSLYRDVNGRLYCKLLNTTINTNLYAISTFNKYYISLYLSDRDSMTGEYIYKLVVKLNNDENIYSYFYRTYNEINFNRIVLDKKNDNSYFYDGLINMLYISNNSSSLNVMSNLYKTEKHIKTVDNIGRLYKEEIYKDNNRLLTKNINHKQTVENGKKKCYNIIEGEEFYTDSFANPVRMISYGISNLTGNITRRTYECPEDIIDESEYLYDNIGQLIEEKKTYEGVRTHYTYDNCGNITKVEEYPINSDLLISKKEFTYDNYKANRLVSVTKGGSTKTISYSSAMPGMPISINDGSFNQILEWSENRLKKYVYADSIYLEYEYDSQGRRIKKTNTDSSALGSITHDYRYSGNKLIEEYVIDDLKGDEYKLHFLYDESEMLYGFEYGSNTYYYLRDSLLNIFGLIDVNGNIVCEYKYDAYGNHKVYNSNNVESTSKYFIGNINPFRYKGYYYDVENQLFYCNSRYYSPELCRFISPDDVEYLDQSSINGLNLYVYCANDPINKYDPTGHFPWTMLFTPVGGVALQVASSTLSYAGMAVASIFDKDIRNDMKAIGWNPFNKDENIVAKSNKVSFYRGVPVFRTSGSSVSFMCILLTKNGFKGSSGHYWTPEDILKHEWGHSIQQMTYGLIPYLVNIGIPSAFIDNSDDAPWEITADLLGGVDRNYNSDDIKQGWNYFSWGRLIGPFWWW